MNFQLGRFCCVIACFPLVCSAMTFSGCEAPTAKKEKPKQESIIGKKTQDIGEYDPDGDAEIADLQVAADSNPLEAISGSYKSATGQISQMAVQQSLQLFWAEHGNYPKDYEEFMEKIIKRNNIQLPVLPGKRRYQYDVKNHKLVVVEAAKETEVESDPEAENSSE